MTTAVKTRKTTAPKSVRAIASTQSLSAFVKSICDVMRRSNCASALQYVPELTWILFLRILDAQEARAAEQAEVLGADFSPALRSPWRWQDWAAPWSDKADHPKTSDGRAQGWKRQELFAAGDGRLFDFINKELLPHLHALDVDPATRLPNPAASPKQRIIGRIMTAVERVRVDDEANLRDILDRVHEISIDDIDDTHFFTLSQVYEDLLLKMGEKNSDGGQFFTPREVIRAMVHTVNPALGQTVYDPCCGTGGFLTVAYEHMRRDQRALLLDLISEYVGRVRPELAKTDLAKIKKAGYDGLRFAWAGSTKRGEGHYYRVQGPTFLLEYDNTQNNANHVHAVWRELNGDFGEDLLAGQHARTVLRDVPVQPVPNASSRRADGSADSRYFVVPRSRNSVAAFSSRSVCGPNSVARASR